MELYWQEKTGVLGEKHYTVWVVDEWMSKEQWWNDNDTKKPKYLEKNLSQSHFAHHKFHIDLPGIKPGPSWQCDNWPPNPQHKPLKSVINSVLLTVQNTTNQNLNTNKLFENFNQVPLKYQQSEHLQKVAVLFSSISQLFLNMQIWHGHNKISH